MNFCRKNLRKLPQYDRQKGEVILHQAPHESSSPLRGSSYANFYRHDQQLNSVQYLAWPTSFHYQRILPADLVAVLPESDGTTDKQHGNLRSDICLAVVLSATSLLGFCFE